MPRYWLMKSEPDVYGWDDLIAQGEGTWDGVRNHRAKANLMAMKIGDRAFFYHSNIGKEVVGIIEISEAGLTDPTDPTGKWAAVKVRPIEKLSSPVSLAAIKSEPALGDSEIVRQSRLSVAELTPAEWRAILRLGKG
jgi:predicted RNA-binding protein with PUA-like domain